MLLDSQPVRGGIRRKAGRIDSGTGELENEQDYDGSLARQALDHRADDIELAADAGAVKRCGQVSAILAAHARHPRMKVDVCDQHFCQAPSALSPLCACLPQPTRAASCCLARSFSN